MYYRNVLYEFQYKVVTDMIQLRTGSFHKDIRKDVEEWGHHMQRTGFHSHCTIYS